MKRHQYGKRLVPFMVFALVMGCKDEVEPPVYQIVPVSARDIIVSVSAAGVIEPIQSIEVKSKASGEIVGVRVETGDVVQRGQLLVSVDPRVPQNAVAQAEAEFGVAQAQLANAESQLNRAEALYASQSITEQEMENARLQRANANAQLIRAERSLEDAKIAFEDTEVRAPADGVILERTVEIGTVISSATREVSGGSVLLRMANLDTVQIRTLVDETDIGKIAPGQDVSISVDAYPNRPFEGNVLKIEPQAVEEQNVTTFPVLVRIPNEGRLLRPGMNAEVEIHVGARADVMAIPNAALRTERDLPSAASVVGLELAVVQQQLAAAREAPGAERRASLGARTADNGSGGDNTVELRGRTVQLPEGLTRAQVQPILDKMQGGGFQSMSDEERAILRRIMQANGGGARRGGFGERSGAPGNGEDGFGTAADGAAADAAPRFQRPRTSNFQFGGDFIVFVMTARGPEARPIRTGLTDLDYSEVVAGLDADDRVLILPSASLVQAQEQFQERMNRMRGGGIPGLSIGGRR
jgi:HlyD family secretion protein